MLQLQNAGTLTSNPFTGGGGPNLAKEYLNKALAVDRVSKQQTSLISAMNSPALFVKARTNEINKIIASLSEDYVDTIKEYEVYYPVEVALKMANEEFEKIFAIKMRQLEIEMPGASALFPYLGTKTANKQSEQSMLVSALGGDEHARYKAYRKKKKAKKGKKSKKKEK
jgi:hypothetical protein